MEWTPLGTPTLVIDKVSRIIRKWEAESIADVQTNPLNSGNECGTTRTNKRTSHYIMK